MPSSSPPNRTDLRRHMRAQRRSLGRQEQRRLSDMLCLHLARSPAFLRSRRIAGYFSNDGEPDLTALMGRIWDAGKTLYVPVIDPGDRLWFATYQPGDPLRMNRYGIPEPCRSGLHLLHARALDLVLMPLVAFDPHGNRLGMGGGYYDRTLAFLHQRRHWARPRLIGIAYGFQRIPALQAQPWDVPLHGAATEHGLLQFHKTIR